MATDRSRSTWGGNVGLIGLVVAGCAVMIALATLMFGQVVGHEFNPQTFERRRFTFYEIPLIRLQVTPLYRNDASGAVEQFVKTQNYITPTPGAPETWHLISFRRSSYQPTPTDVLILQRYLDARDSDYGSYWQEWSVEHPQLAAVLWPEVARLARLNSYVFLPSLFELAGRATESTNPQEFQAQLRAITAEQLSENINRLKGTAAETKDAALQVVFQQRAADLSAAVEQLQSAPKLEADVTPSTSEATNPEETQPSPPEDSGAKAKEADESDNASDPTEP